MKIENKQCTYAMENGDEYIISREGSIWKLHIKDKDHPNGKYVTSSKDINKIFDRIPEGMT